MPSSRNGSTFIAGVRWCKELQVLRSELGFVSECPSPAQQFGVGYCVPCSLQITVPSEGQELC